MSTYDYFYKSIEKGDVSKLGLRMMHFQNKHFFKTFQENINKDSKIKLLEIGPGNGFFAHVAKSKKEYAYECVEANGNIAQNLRKKGFEVTEAYVPPIETGKKYDIIFANQLLEHMNGRDEAIHLVKSAHDSLEEDGLVLFSCPEIYFQKFDFFQDYTHDFPTTAYRVRNLLEDNGFEVLDVVHYTFFVRGRLWCMLVEKIARIGYGLGLFHLLFGDKAYKVKISLLPSFYVLAKKYN